MKPDDRSTLDEATHDVVRTCPECGESVIVPAGVRRVSCPACDTEFDSRKKPKRREGANDAERSSL